MSERKDPRNNADHAYEAFMSMGDSEWKGLLLSLGGGGCLQVEEKKGFDRAYAERKKAPVIPDYSDEVPAQEEQKEDAMTRLNRFVTQMAVLELERLELEVKLKSVEKDLKTYAENLVPEVMTEIGLTELKTKTGMTIELKEEVRMSFPKDPEKKARAFAYLKETGNDGLITREIVINYGRDSTEYAEQLLKTLEELNVKEHATVENTETTNHQSTLAFLRRQIKEAKEKGTLETLPLDAFGAFIQKFAKIKAPK
jgi:hypothetical protein